MLSRLSEEHLPLTDEESEKAEALSDIRLSTSPVSPTTLPSEYGEIDEGNDFIVGSGMVMVLWEGETDQ